MESYIKQQHPLNRLFLALSAVSLLLWSYAVLTTSIDHVPMVNMPILHIMPATYWVGFAMLVLATIVWYFSPETKWYHFSLLLFWTLYIFIGPEMMEVNARGYDAIGHLLGVTYIDQGRSSEYWYIQWPGFVFFSSFLYKVTGVGFFALYTLVSLSLHLLRMVFIGYLGTRLFSGKKQALLFSVLLIGFFWEPQAFDPSAQHFGIIIMLPLLALCFSAKQLNARRRALIIALFGTLVITHILTSFIVALIIIFLSLMSLTGRRFGYSRDISGYTLAALFIVSFLAYLMYTTDWVVNEAVAAFIRAFRDPLLPARFFVPTSSYEEFVMGFVYLFYLVLLVWMVIIAARKEFWTNLLNRVFPLLCLIPVSLVIIPYGFAALPRFYILGVPFIVWFLARESHHIGRVVVTVFMVVLLAMSFGERYQTEYVTYVPTADFAGARFITSKIPLSDTLYTPTYYNPSPMSRANVLEQPNLVSGTKPFGKYLQPAFPFAARSMRNENFVRFHGSEKDLSDITEAFYPYKGNIIYTNGDYQVYAYRYKRE